jgi:branched-chain amino acid transport system ATP-binding protein
MTFSETAGGEILEIKNLMVFYENAIAINNINMKCQAGKVTGIFGANSAGKSTLMYTISGIILDVKKKEEMKGGERITVLGHITFEGMDITSTKPSDRARKGIILCPERRRIFAESSTLENLKIGGYLASKSEAKKTLEYVFTMFPPLRKLKGREGGFLRRTADACHWEGFDGPAQIASSG